MLDSKFVNRRMGRRSFLKSAGLVAATMCLDLPAAAKNVTGMVDSPLRIGILSDIHITDVPSADTFRHALEYFRSQEADGVIIAGDMADLGLVSQLKIVADTWYSVFPKDKLPNGKHIEKLFAYGNHDVIGHTYTEELRAKSHDELEKIAIGLHRDKVWKNLFHEDYNPIYMKTVKGYHFVCAHWNNDQEVDGLPAFLEQHKSELAGDKPFFYVQHAHPLNTTFGELAWGPDNGVSTKALSQFPNAVAFSGHSHMPLEHEYCLWQEAFTSIGTSSLRYLCPLGARENSYVDGGAQVSSQMPTADTTKDRQGMLMTVYDDHISIERRDFMHDEPLAADWVLPLPINSQMSWENREKKSVAPEFAKDDKVNVREIKDGEDRYGVKQEQVEVSFPSVQKKRTGVRAIDYEIQVEQKYVDTLNIVATKRVFSPGAHSSDNFDDQKVICLFGKKELPATHKYRFIVRPCDSFSKKGKAIYSEWYGEYVK